MVTKGGQAPSDGICIALSITRCNHCWRKYLSFVLVLGCDGRGDQGPAVQMVTKDWYFQMALVQAYKAPDYIVWHYLLDAYHDASHVF